jgi:anaerobic dimethyl sulfoxide reductase subunit B (iron-sulfur subunit)
VTFLSSACFHCANPACLTACPVESISKRERDGIVVVDKGKCLGKDDCGACREACPYEAPQFGAEENAKMQKCDLCFDRMAEGQKPICVAACRTRALDAGPLDELDEKFVRVNEASGMTYSPKVKPSVIFKPK